MKTDPFFKFAVILILAGVALAFSPAFPKPHRHSRHPHASHRAATPPPAVE